MTSRRLDLWSRLRPRRRWLRFMLPAAAVIVVLAGAGLAAFESDIVPSFWQGLWWALSLMTTVGFAGHAPSTTAGRLLSAVLMLGGFVLLSMTTAAVASIFVREDEEPEERALRAFEERALAEMRRLHERLDRIESGLRPRPRRVGGHHEERSQRPEA